MQEMVLYWSHALPLLQWRNVIFPISSDAADEFRLKDMLALKCNFRLNCKANIDEQNSK